MYLSAPLSSSDARAISVFPQIQRVSVADRIHLTLKIITNKNTKVVSAGVRGCVYVQVTKLSTGRMTGAK